MNAINVLYSFNNSPVPSVWRGFTLDNWANPCSQSGMCASVVTSLQVGFLATLVVPRRR